MSKAGKAAGFAGETRAVEELETRGFRIIARNFRSRTGEVDLIALEGDTLVFIEVKAWSCYGMEELSYGVDQKKRRRIIETAKYFLSSHREYNGMAVRFDIIFIAPHSGPESLTHLRAAFTESL
jgi:putative endonuclease